VDHRGNPKKGKYIVYHSRQRKRDALRIVGRKPTSPEEGGGKTQDLIAGAKGKKTCRPAQGSVTRVRSAKEKKEESLPPMGG